MIFGGIVLSVFVWIASTVSGFHAPFDWGPVIYEYEITTYTYEVYPQDDIDAKAIIDGKMSETVFASIIPYRDKCRRTTIIREIGVLNKGKDYINDGYVPQIDGTTPFQDLVYGFMKDESTALGGFLHQFFNRKDETWIIIAMVLTKDIQQLIETYDGFHDPKFKTLRKKQRHPFENLLRVWVNKNREANEKGPLDQNSVQKDATALKSEYECGGWLENRDQIELILIKKSIKYARAVLQQFEKAEGGKSIETILANEVQCHGLNHDLADAYSSLARYIKDKHQYTADIMHQYSDGSDKWAAWIMCIAVTLPQEWPSVNIAFQKNHPGDSLSKFIMQKLTTDKVMAEMIAVIVDPSFKPTTFTKKPVENGAIPPTMPPPAPSTALAPSPSG